MKITETACVSDELRRLLKEEEEEEEDRQIVSLGDSRIKRVRDNIAFLSMVTVRVVVLDSPKRHHCKAYSAGAQSALMCICT